MARVLWHVTMSLDGFIAGPGNNPPKDPSVTFLSGDITRAVEKASEAAGDKYLVIFGADVARQCIEAGLLEEALIHVVPTLLGDGVRLFSRPGGDAIRLELAGVSRANQVTNLRLWYIG